MLITLTVSRRAVSTSLYLDDRDSTGNELEVLSSSGWRMKIPHPPLRVAAPEDPSV